MVFLAACMLALLTLMAAGALYQWVGARRDDRDHPPPGQMVAAGDARLHVRVSGAGPVTVVLEAGIAASSLSWSLLEAEVAKFCRVISYDRAGLGWSDPAPGPRMPDRVVAELDAALRAMGAQPPYILVGHSYGGIIVQLFARAHSRDVAGLLLLDPVAPVEWFPASDAQRGMIRRAAALSRRGATLAHIGVVRLCLGLVLAGARRFPQAVARAASGPGIEVVNRLAGEVGKLPRDLWPVVRAHWCRSKTFHAMADYLEALPATCEALARGSSCPTPTVVLSAGNAADLRAASHSELGERRVVAESGHWIQLDQPEIVVAAIREMVANSIPGLRP